MAVPSDLFTFDSVADDEAKARRTDVSNSTISNMMKMTESNLSPASASTFESNLDQIYKERNDYSGLQITNPEIDKAMFSMTRRSAKTPSVLFRPGAY